MTRREERMVQNAFTYIDNKLSNLLIVQENIEVKLEALVELYNDIRERGRKL